MPLVTANQYDLVPQFSNIGTGFAQGQQIANQFQIGQQNKQKLDATAEESRIMSVVQGASEIVNLPDDTSKLNALYKRKQQLIQQGKPTQDTDEVIGLFEAGDSKSANGLIQSVVDMGIQTGRLKAPAASAPGFSLGQGQKRFDAAGNEIASVDPKPEKPISALDQAKIDNLKAETAVFKGGLNTKDLDTLVSEASPELQEQAKAAYSLSGGGDKGVKAVKEVLESGVELERRAKAPELLKANFPQADESELKELQAVVDSAKTTESGFKAASELRDKQRQVKKGKVFQKRAVELLDRILNADELNDVIGSYEGSDESIIPFGGKKIRGDAESEIIADIEEAGNILTADNLDIMSGVLSETDIKIIANLAGGALNRKRGEEAFKRDVSKLKEKLQNAIGVVGGNKLPTGTKDNGNGTFTLPNGQIVRRKRD